MTRARRPWPVGKPRSSTAVATQPRVRMVHPNLPGQAIHVHRPAAWVASGWLEAPEPADDAEATPAEPAGEVEDSRPTRRARRASTEESGSNGDTAA